MSEPRNQRPLVTGANKWKVVAVILAAVIVVLVVVLAELIVWESYSSNEARVGQACADAKLTLLDPEKNAALSEDERRRLEIAVKGQCQVAQVGSSALPSSSSAYTRYP